MKNELIGLVEYVKLSIQTLLKLFNASTDISFNIPFWSMISIRWYDSVWHIGFDYYYF